MAKKSRFYGFFGDYSLGLENISDYTKIIKKIYMIYIYIYIYISHSYCVIELLFYVKTTIRPYTFIPYLYLKAISNHLQKTPFSKSCLIFRRKKNCHVAEELYLFYFNVFFLLKYCQHKN